MVILESLGLISCTNFDSVPTIELIFSRRSILFTEYYVMKKVCFGLILLCVLTGCAAPKATQIEASRYLKEPCLSLFLNGSLGGYQHVVNRPFNAQAVMAMAEDPQTGAQKCGIARNIVDINGTSLLADDYTGEKLWAALESIAIGRCEELAGKGRCRVFARNNQILWNKSGGTQKPSFK